MEIADDLSIYRIQSNPILTVFNVISDVMKMSHHNFGNLSRTSQMTTDNYGKKQHKTKVISKIDRILVFLEVSRYRQLYLLDIFLCL